MRRKRPAKADILSLWKDFSLAQQTSQILLFLISTKLVELRREEGAMPILGILLASGLLAGWYAFDEWQFRRRVRLCSEWVPDDDDFGYERDSLPVEKWSVRTLQNTEAAPGHPTGTTDPEVVF